ncbi:ammonium transporter 3 member 2-like [Lycium ferocissimum]|uniref:ammonium transporter 3 member 2-like n=1 Tax=Lycium ferocissimum TaxID=112874 RepID=UPI002815A5D3|nr:ammonium transporter 3 member 2-like [Lycium ferocissimum]
MYEWCMQAWAAIVMGMISGSIPLFSTMILHRKSTFLPKAVFHTHAVAGLLGGLLTGLLEEPTLCSIVLPGSNRRRTFYGGGGGILFLKQIVAALFIIDGNIVATMLILLAIRLFIPLRMADEQIMIGDAAVHGHEAYDLWGDGETCDPA